MARVIPLPNSARSAGGSPGKIAEARGAHTISSAILTRLAAEDSAGPKVMPGIRKKAMAKTATEMSTGMTADEADAVNQ